MSSHRSVNGAGERTLAQVILSPWRLSIADKSACVSLIVIPLATLYILWERRFLARPDLAPYLDPAFLRWVYWAHIAMVVAWVGVLGSALVLRRRNPEGRLLAYVLSQLYAVGFTLTSYWLGHYTTGYTDAVLLGGIVVGFLLFDKPPVLLGIASGLLIIVGTTVAEQMGRIPYAPLLASAPVSDHRLATSWLTSYAGVTFVVVLVVVGIVYHVCYRLRDREDELARTSEQLGRANQLISRYVAAQVAEQIMAGDYSAVDQHARRRLTLFFSDVADFTEIAERMEPEDLSRILNEYFSEMTAIALRHGGTIDKFIGDAIMILFGAPVATDDREQALRAVRMAIEMQRALEPLHGRWLRQGVEEPFRVRMGVNSGVATVGNFGSAGRMDYTAIGRQVNLAARLQAACEPGRILCSHSTWLLVHDELPCVPKGEVQVKGIQHPVKAYEVVV